MKEWVALRRRAASRELARLGRADWLAANLIWIAGLTGCPVTDDYFLLSDSPGGSRATGGGGEASGASVGGKGGAVEGLVGGAPGAAGDGGCVPQPERCNGYDDDCSGTSDEQACPMGCFGFAAGAAARGYMFCGGPARNATREGAEVACIAQGQHLAAIEDAAENAFLVSTLNPLTPENLIYLGGSDAAMEGNWRWAGGAPFWLGNAQGAAVAGAFVAWNPGRPDNSGSNEDCAVLQLDEQTWDDRNCIGVHPFVCEDP